MKYFLNLVSLGCFCFGVFAGANTQSLREYSLKENKLKVTSTKISILDGRFWWDVPAKRHEIKIGDAVCFYETDRGGCACWEVEFNNEIFARYYKAEAIIKAVELQVK